MPQPSRAFCITGLTALSAAILVLLPLRIGSQQPNSSVAPADLNPSVAWATVVDYRVRERADWRTPALLQYGVALRRARPDLSADEIMDRMQAADDLASGKYSDEGADLLAEAVAVVPEADSGGAGALPLVRRLAGAYSDVTLPSVTNEDFFAAYESNPLQ